MTMWSVAVWLATAVAVAGAAQPGGAWEKLVRFKAARFGWSRPPTWDPISGPSFPSDPRAHLSAAEGWSLNGASWKRSKTPDPAGFPGPLAADDYYFEDAAAVASGYRTVPLCCILSHVHSSLHSSFFNSQF